MMKLLSPIHWLFGLLIAALIGGLLLNTAALVALHQRYDALAALVAAADPLEVAALPSANVDQPLWALHAAGAENSPAPDQPWIAVYPTSTLWSEIGAPSLRFVDHSPYRSDYQRDFEIGFYRYGPTWYTRNPIVEFWLGRGYGGTLSVVGNDGGGAEIQVRNPTDTDGISLLFTDADRPVIRTETGRPLHFFAPQGLISDSPHWFQHGIGVTDASGRIGTVETGWVGGSLHVAAPTIKTGDRVFITPLSAAVGSWWVGHVLPGSGFTVHSTAAHETLKFHWLIVAGD